MLRRDAPVNQGHMEVAAGMSRRGMEEFIVKKDVLVKQDYSRGVKA